MLDRVFITLIIAGSIGLLWLGWQYYKARLRHTIRPDEVARGKPTLLYFTGDYCAICKVQQTPIVERVAAKLGHSVAVNIYDVSKQPDLARRYKVLTLPTTVILNKQGQVAHINYGVISQPKLEAQLL